MIEERCLALYTAPIDPRPAALRPWLETWACWLALRCRSARRKPSFWDRSARKYSPGIHRQLQASPAHVLVLLPPSITSRSFLLTAPTPGDSRGRPRRRVLHHLLLIVGTTEPPQPSPRDGLRPFFLPPRLLNSPAHALSLTIPSRRPAKCRRIGATSLYPVRHC